MSLDEARRTAQTQARDLPPGARILLVDDHQKVRTTLRTVLADERLQVCGEATNGREAIERVRELKPDLVILDLMMPEMNGIEAAYEIRKAAPGTKILFYSVHGSPESRAAARLIGADAYVQKSSARELLHEIRRLLRMPGGGADGA